MRVPVLALCMILLSGCARYAAPPVPCQPLPNLDKQPTDAEFRVYIETLATLYAECAARNERKTP